MMNPTMKNNSYEKTTTDHSVTRERNDEFSVFWNRRRCFEFYTRGEKAAVSLTNDEPSLSSRVTQTKYSDFEALFSSLEDVGFEAEVEKETSIANIFLSVEGMTCSACTSAVEHALNDTPGVLAPACRFLRGRKVFLVQPTGPRTIISAVMIVGLSVICYSSAMVKKAGRRSGNRPRSTGLC